MGAKSEFVVKCQIKIFKGNTIITIYNHAKSYILLTPSQGLTCNNLCMSFLRPCRTEMLTLDSCSMQCRQYDMFYCCT